jgi:copper chaperone CopZ
MSNQEFQEEIINIVGMHCKSCAEGIETKLLQLNGVDKVRVSLVEEKAYIRFDPSLITIEKIKEKIREIGYDTGNDTKNTGKNSIKQGNSIWYYTAHRLHSFHNSINSWRNSSNRNF